MLLDWDKLPEIFRNQSVLPYYAHLKNKHTSLIVKRIFDVIAATLLLVAMFPWFLIISVAIKLDSKGPIMFRQIRITQYKKSFRIFKFRTMVNNAEKFGSQVTVKNDDRVTHVGKYLRKLRLDETPQLINIILGEMSFVGTRPEIEKYVDNYSPEMMATLLLPAGVTSEASIRYKDEDLLLASSDDADQTYIDVILPEKMKFNLKSLLEFSFRKDIKVILLTVCAMFEKPDKAVESH